MLARSNSYFFLFELLMTFDLSRRLSRQHPWRARAHHTEDAARPREIAKTAGGGNHKTCTLLTTGGGEKIRWILVLASIEERAAEAVNSSHCAPPPNPHPCSVWKKIQLFPVSQKTFFLIYEKEDKKIHFRFLCVLHLCDHFKRLQCYCALDVRRGPNENIELFLLLLLLFFSRCHNPGTVTPLQCSCGLHSSWKIWQPEMFFFFLFKPTISYFLL